jgi:hypothetical protein
MPTIGTGRVQAQTGLVSFTQTAASSTSVASFALQTPTTGVNLYETFANNSGNITLGLRSIAAGNGVTLVANRGVIYITVDAAFTAGYALLDGNGLVPWVNLPPEVQTLPLAFVIPGKPSAGQPYNVVLPIVCVVAADLVGTVIYAGTPATADAMFTLYKISAGVTTPIGAVTLAAGSHTVCALSNQTFTQFQAGDVLRLVAPDAQDSTLADLGITVLALKT